MRKTLPSILLRLVAEGYQFAAWDGNGFTLAKAAKTATAPVLTAGSYGDAWAKIGEKEKAANAYVTYLELAPKGPGAQHVKEQLGRL